MEFTENQKYQLIGLQTVAQSLLKQLDVIVTAAEEITGNRERSSDWVWSEEPISKLSEWLLYDEGRNANS